MLYLDFEKKEIHSSVPTSLDPSSEFENEYKNAFAPLYFYIKEELDYIKRKTDELRKANPQLVRGKSYEILKVS